MKVKLKALREFPMGEESRRMVTKGEEFEVNSSEAAFFEETKRAKRIEPVADKPAAAKKES